MNGSEPFGNVVGHRIPVMMRSAAMGEPSVDREAILNQLERLLMSSVFRRAERSSALLRFLVERTLDGQADRLKEYTLGAEALGRGQSFDPRVDPVVRAEASRLRARIDQYYETAGRTDPIRITLAKGSYVPQFLPQSPTTDRTAPVERPRIVQLASKPMVAWTCAMAAVLAAVLAWMQVRSNPAPAPMPAQFEVELKSDGVLASDVGTTVVLSPNGHRIVFVTRAADGRTHLNVRQLDRPDAIRVAGTEGARAPFVSFDGRWVGFWADGKLKKVALDGGAPVVLCDAADLLGASWGEDNTIVAALGAPGQLSRIPSDGGEPAVVIDRTSESVTVRWPQVLPGGESVIYTAMSGTGADRANIEAQSIRGGSRKILVQGATFGRYLPNGYLTYVNQGTLYALEFDPSSLTVRGAPIPLFDDVAYSALFGYAQFDVSRTGMLVYRKGAESQRSVINWIRRDGHVAPLLSTPGRYGWMRLSPDGQRLALTTLDSGIASISIFDRKTSELTRVTSRPGEYTGLTWLTDGLLAFGGATGLGLVGSNTSDPSPLLPARIAQTPWSVTRDGQRLAYYERGSETGFDLWTVSVQRKSDGVIVGEPEPFLRTRSFEVYPSFSPDGRWLAYASNESGAWEIYVRRFPDDGTRVRVSKSGGVVPHWSPNARELLYRTSAQQVMVVPYRIVDGSFVAGRTRPWSQHTLADTGVMPNFEVSSTGDEILALMSAADPQTVNHVTLWLNFAEELRRRKNAR